MAIYKKSQKSKIIKKFSEKLDEIGLEYHEMESSYLLWINLSKTKKDSKWWTNRLKQKGVLVENGEDFVENGEKYIRINLGIPTKYLVEVLKILKEECNEFIVDIK